MTLPPPCRREALGCKSLYVPSRRGGAFVCYLFSNWTFNPVLFCNIFWVKYYYYYYRVLHNKLIRIHLYFSHFLVLIGSYSFQSNFLCIYSVVIAADDVTQIEPPRPLEVEGRSAVASEWTRQHGRPAGRSNCQAKRELRQVVVTGRLRGGYGD